MLTRIAVEVNRSGQLLKVSDIEFVACQPAFGYYDDIPIALDVSEDLLFFFGERAACTRGYCRGRTVRSYLYGDLATHVLAGWGPVNDAELPHGTRRPARSTGFGMRSERPESSSCSRRPPRNRRPTRRRG
jgi:hypothetical protein